MNNVSKMSKFCSMLFVISAILIIFAPYQPDSTLSLSSTGLQNIFKVLIYLFTFINLSLIVLPLFKFKKTSSGNLIKTLPMIIYFSLSVLHTYNTSLNFSGFLFMILWIIFALSSEEIQLQTFKYLKKIWIFISILGIILYANYILKLFIPYEIRNYYSLHLDTGLIEKYIDYKFIYLYQSTHTYDSFSLVRLCGICNEPGYFGTICALLLCAGNIKIKDKSNICLLIAGILSFSLGFYIVLIIGIILKNLRSLKTIAITLAIISVYLFVIPNIKTGNQSIDKFINRMTISNQGLTGDNRSTIEVDTLYDSVVRRKPLFGYGNGFLKSQVFTGGNATYKSYVIEYGIIGCLLIWGTLLIGALYKNTKNFLIIVYVVAFFSSIYQRPNIMTLIYEILLFGAIEFIKFNVKKETINNFDES